MTTGAQKQNVPRLRFPEFRDEWVSELLGRLCKVFDGTHQTPIYKKEGVSFYSVENVTNDNFTNVKFISKNIYDKELIKPEIGDILMTRIGDIGTSKLIDWDVCASFYVSLALIKKSNKINNAYLDKYISSVGFQRELWRRTIHVAFPKKINLGEIGSCIVSFPDDCIEQQKIATFLTAVDNKISLLTKKVDNLEKYKKGLMNQIFSQKVRFKDDNGEAFPDWEVKLLHEILSEASKVSVKDINNYRKITIKLNKRGINFSADSRKMADRRPFYTRQSGELIIGKQNFFNGSIAIVGDLYNNCICSNAIMSFRVDNKLCNINFLYEYTSRRDYLKKHEMLANGTGQKELSEKDFLDFEIKLPTVSEQQKIATLLTSFDNKITHIRNQLDKTKEFKKALMQRMFV